MPHIMKLLFTPGRAGCDAILVWAKDSAVTILSPLWKVCAAHDLKALGRPLACLTYLARLGVQSCESGYVGRLLHINQRKIYYCKT